MVKQIHVLIVTDPEESRFLASGPLISLSVT